MINCGKNSELSKFIIGQSDSYNAISEAIENFAWRNKRELEFLDDQNAYITFDDIDFKYALNITIDGDMVEFDAVVEGSFTWQTRRNYHYDVNDEIGYQWFGLHCVMKITEKLESFKVTRIERYTNEQKKNLMNPATADFVPVIHKKDFDDEANKFLEKWYPQALKEPICLPIKEIAEKGMGLKVITDVPLTKDLMVFGQICFANGEINTYNEKQDKYVKTHVERGMVFIDPNTYFLRCLGCVHNTIAHEAFHWERHRVYATIKSILNKKQTVAQRCPTKPKGNIVRDIMTSDEDWMEWQANGIAPKILMPKIPTIRKIKEVAIAYGYHDQCKTDPDKLTAIIDELADFYQVSKQAAKIRMIELGYSEAMDVYNYESNCTLRIKDITPADAYTEYESNEEFKILFDMGLFRNVEGYFVIDTAAYREQNEQGEYKLTEYAKENLDDCTLTFEYSIIDLFEFNREQGVLYKGQRQPRAHKLFAPELNEESINKALAEVSAAQRQIEAAQEFGDLTPAQMIIIYMERAKPKWNSTVFQQRTGLRKNEHSKIMTKPNRKFELPIIVSICVGLKLPNEHARELITKAGYVLGKTSPEDIAYGMIISGAVSDNIIACNAFIEKLEENNPGFKIRKLGSQTYDGQSADEE